MSQLYIDLFEKLKSDTIINFSALCNKKNWTQEFAAEKIKCSRSHLSKILSGKRNPSLTILKNMEEVLENERK